MKSRGLQWVGVVVLVVLGLECYGTTNQTQQLLMCRGTVMQVEVMNQCIGIHFTSSTILQCSAPRPTTQGLRSNSGGQRQTAATATTMASDEPQQLVIRHYPHSVTKMSASSTAALWSRSNLAGDASGCRW
jgi:hypothetical protein